MENQGFNLSTIKNSGNKVAEEGVEYITITDGNGGKLKIMNLEHEMYAPREGIVELVPLKIARGLNNAIRHQNEVRFGAITDRATGWIIGIPIPGYKKDKSIGFEIMVVNSAEFLDLSIPKQRLKWICIKNGPFMKDSPNFVPSSKTVYLAVDREKQANEFKINRRVRRKASEIAESLVGEELNDMAIALGFDPKIYSSEGLWMEVVKFAENENKVNGKTGGQRFMEVYESDTRLELIVLKRALSVGILTDTPKDGIAYNGVSLGFSELEAINYLKGHQNTLVSIDTQSKQKQSGSTQAFEKTAPPVIKDEKDLIIERQNREMEEMMKKLSIINEQVLETKSEAEVNELDPKLVPLYKEGKRLGLKVHLIARYDDVDTRVQKIQAEIDKKMAASKN